LYRNVIPMIAHKSIKYSNILETAKELFWQHGFKRISIEEICKQSSVSKMTFYKYFPNKTEVAKLLLNMIWEDVMNEFSQIILSDLTIEDKIRKSILLELKTSDKLSIVFINDIFQNREEQLVQLIDHYKKEGTTMLFGLLTNAQDEKIIRSDIKVDFIMYQVSRIFDTLKDEALLSQYGSLKEFALENINFLLYGLIPKR